MARPSVFISSTSEDLRAYRAAARDAALRAGFFPVMMEYWTAEANDPLDVCLGRVDEAELLVAIVAHRYGWKPPDQPDGDVPRASPGWNANGPWAVRRMCSRFRSTKRSPGRPSCARNTVLRTWA